MSFYYTPVTLPTYPLACNTRVHLATCHLVRKIGIMTITHKRSSITMYAGRSLLVAALATLLFSGCETWSKYFGSDSKPPLRAIDRRVDLNRFMGNN